MLKKYLTLLLFILLINFGFEANGQNSVHNNYFIESNYQYGFIWQHSPSLADVIGGNINVFQLTFGKETFGQKYWEQLYRYPEWGVGYYFADLGNPEELGQANAIYWYINIPVLKKRKFTLGYRISGGLGYLNQGNIAIGSHLNLYFDAHIDTKIRLSDHFYLVNAFGATHFSNGAIDMPNLGVNIFSYRIGIHYKINTPEREKIKLPLPKLVKKNSISTVIGAGIKEQRPDGSEKLTVASGSVDYMRLISLKHKFGAGIDVFYDESLFKLMDPDSSLNLTNSDIMRYGFHLSFEAKLNRLVLAIHLGTYLHAKYTDDGKIYQRVALRYLFTKNIFANISLKTSKGVADFVEWGVGYQFYWK